MPRKERTIFIPTIVLAECKYLITHRKIELDFQELLERIEGSKNFVPILLNAKTNNKR